MFGFRPFACQNGRLTLTLSPMLPARLIPADGIVEAVFLGSCRIRYHIPAGGSLIPGRYAVEKYALEGAEYADLPEGAAERIRSGEIRDMDVYIRRL